MSHHDPPDAATRPGQQLYHSVLLRYWREDAAAWRYLVQDLDTGEQYSFANMDLLVAFLYQHIENQAQ